MTLVATRIARKSQNTRPRVKKKKRKKIWPQRLTLPGQLECVNDLSIPVYVRNTIRTGRKPADGVNEKLTVNMYTV